MDNDELKVAVQAFQTTREFSVNFDVTIPTILNYLKQIGKVKKLRRFQ